MIQKTDADRPVKDKAYTTIDILKIVFFVYFFISALMLIYFSAIDRSNPVEPPEPYVFDDWRVTAPDGTMRKAGSSYRHPSSSSGVFTAVTVLPEEIENEADFCLVLGGDAAVYVKGELRKDHVESRDVVIPGGSVKRFYFVVPIYPSDAGGELKIVRTGTTRLGWVYQNTLLIPNGALFSYLMQKYGTPFMLAEILFILSLVTVFLSIIMMLIYKHSMDMLYGAMGILVISAWIVTNSYLYPFIYGHYHVDGLINYMLCLMMPFGHTFYLNALQHKRYARVYSVVLWLSVASCIVWPVLHLLGIYSLSYALTYIDLILGIQVVTVLTLLVMDLVKGKIVEYKYTAIGVAGFLFCGLFELVILNFIPTMQQEMPMLIGLAISLSLSVIQQLEDIKKMREERQRAMDLSETKTRFLASMSHEIRTPINAILGMNEMILRENRDPVIEDYAGSIKSSGRMLLMLVNDVLDFSKIEAGKMEIVNVEFRLSRLLKDIIPILKERADEKDLELKTELLSEVPDGLVSDEFRIRQVIINIVNNAIKYTDAGAVTLSIGGHETDNDGFLLEMSVKDTGRGISEEGQKNLFEAFSRADSSKNRNIEGTGLGLAIVKSIMDSMNGMIGVKSKLGEGSQFDLEIPVKVWLREPLTESLKNSCDLSEGSGGECDYRAPRAAVLAVDDNSANLRIVKLFLKRPEIEPDLCDSGRRALELCREKHYDLILIDHMMPEPDGVETLHLIRNTEDSLNKDTPVIVLTANALAGSRQAYLDEGFADYLTKPLDSSLLEQTVKQYLPADKIEAVSENDAKTQETGAENVPVHRTLKERLTAIEGLDYDTALRYTGNSEAILDEFVRDLVKACNGKIANMRRCVAEKDMETYCMEAHAIKGMMATIGLSSFSERAKKHEFAARENNYDFITTDCDDFLEEYRSICNRLAEGE